MNRAVWQVGAGPENRRYAEVFLRFGVALIGPGDAGRWIRYRLYDAENDFAPLAYANLVNLKKKALHCFELLRRP